MQRCYQRSFKLYITRKPNITHVQKTVLLSCKTRLRHLNFILILAKLEEFQPVELLVELQEELLVELQEERQEELQVQLGQEVLEEPLDLLERLEEQQVG